MLTNFEKRVAVLREFPHVPTQDLSWIISRIVTDSDLYRLGSIVAAYVRHSKTHYEELLPIGCSYSGSWKQARENVSGEVLGLMKSWR